MWRYHKYLPSVPEIYRVNLGEGQTPLVRSRNIGPALGLKNLFFKLENLNPTGSYKDRFAGVFVSAMKNRGQDLCLATSSGNTGAALAAYCAAAGIKCVLAIVDGAPLAKIKQMQLYGAHTYMINGFGKDPQVTTDVFELLNNLAKNMGLPLPVSAYKYCPEGMQGVQTMAYEILDEVAAGHIFVPAGGGGLTLSIAKGAMDYAAKLTHLPKVNCVQPEGNATIAGPLRMGDVHSHAVAASTTAISGLQVPSILDGDEVISACRQLGGNGYLVTDAEVFEYQRKLAQQEGIFAEPAGAVALAGLAIAIKNKEIEPDDNVVCLITGSGFKDMLSVETNFALPQIQTMDSGALANIINYHKNHR